MLMPQQTISLCNTDTSSISPESMNSVTKSSTLETILSSMKTHKHELQALKQASQGRDCRTSGAG